jgi:hypothetical protein
MPKGKGYGGGKTGAKMPTKTGNRPASGSKKK